ARTARFALPETARGLVANCGALFRTPRALPRNIANEMLLTGEPLDAERVCANAPVAQRATLGAVSEVVADEESRGWAATERAQIMVNMSQDADEGVAAFREKRSPRWNGR
ncbi:MAG TPA: enoyl-CoA hydratase-related protein, partial [Pseudonocardia sp.]